ncbi:MAG TPA: GNAT family N-acetyltransferase [Nitrospira sp.]|nr:GNAT family N-acetyltransferase [Nitrospira sp.]
MVPRRPRYLPPLLYDKDESASVILRDGSTAIIRPADPDDTELMQEFVARLSPACRHQRFFSAGEPPAELVRALCDSSDPRAQHTLVVTRISDGASRIIASGSYWAKDPLVAEIAMAVDDHFHHNGLGTLLLERLALSAVRHGFTHLWAVTRAENRAMREVFKESGFTTREAYESGDIEVELSLTPTDTTVRRAELRERLATIASLRPLFHPHTVAVIGASRNPQRIGSRLLEAITVNGFQGSVFPVNPHATEIRGLRAYPSVRQVPVQVDLAVIAVPRDQVMGVVEDCAAGNVRVLVMVTAGFAETGAEGAALQAALLRKVRENGMRMIGPNCFGVLTTDAAVHLNATFSSLFPPTGRVAMSSQSGAIGLATLAGARHRQLGISSFVSVGNKADVSTNDLLQYWEEDPCTDVILLYLESFGNPRRFARIARRVARRKPIVAVKGGRSSSGRRAAGSHTAALAASDVAVDALLHQAGVIRTETLDDMLAVAGGLVHQPLPAGRRVGIITNAGGPAILCADACEGGGLTVPEFSTRTKSALRGIVSPNASVNNPVDLIASATPEQYARAIETLLCADEIDALIVLYVSITPLDTTGIAEAIQTGIGRGREAGAKSKPVLIGWMAEGDADRRFLVSAETIPAYPLPETPAMVLGEMASHAEWRQRPLGMVVDFDDLNLSAAREVCTAAVTQRGNGWLTTEETRTVLSAMQLPVQPGGIAHTADHAGKLAKHIGFPVAVKLASRRIVHKTDVGGVRLNLESERAVREAFESIRTALEERGQSDAMEGVLVQPMISSGVEVMVGVTHDPLFGPLIVFGLGGIHVEILGDVQVRLSPLTDRDAADMIREIKGYPLLTGYRGHPAADLSALEEVLLRVSRLAEEIPEIQELDINPLFAGSPGQGCRIADARIYVRANEARAV